MLSWKVGAPFFLGRKILICSSTYLCIYWLILVCALTGDWTHNLGVLGWCSNQLSYPARASHHFLIPPQWVATAAVNIHQRPPSILLSWLSAATLIFQFNNCLVFHHMWTCPLVEWAAPFLSPVQWKIRSYLMLFFIVSVWHSFLLPALTWENPFIRGLWPLLEERKIWTQETTIIAADLGFAWPKGFTIWESLFNVKYVKLPIQT